jgi:hypothetical protein
MSAIACPQQLSRSAGNSQSVGCKVQTSEKQPSTVAFGKGDHHDEPARTFHHNFAQQRRLPAFALALLCALTMVETRPAQAQTLTVLYDFTSGGDGSFPIAGLTRQAATPV